MYPSDASRTPARASAARTSRSSLPQLEECPHCHETKLPHHVCPNCGYYQGRRRSSSSRADSAADDAAALTAVTEPRPAATEAAAGGVRVAVDAMGGDHGPPRSSRAPSTTPAPTPRIGSSSSATRPTVGAHRRRRCPANVAIVHASQVIGMDEHPALALREKKDASILVATDLVRRGEADAVVTAGHTGAGMAAAVLRLGRLPGVDRPALAVQMIDRRRAARPARHRRQPRLDRPRTSPSTRGWARSSPSGCWASPSPRVALLSIGEEKGKGDARIQRATELLDASDLRFVGNVEGKDLAKHLADVVVCDAVARQRRRSSSSRASRPSSSTCGATEFRRVAARAGSRTS